MNDPLTTALVGGLLVFAVGVALMWWRDQRQRRRTAEAHVAAASEPRAAPRGVRLRPLPARPLPIPIPPAAVQPPRRSTRLAESSPPLTAPKRWDPRAYGSSERPTRPERASRPERIARRLAATPMPRPVRPSDDADDDLWIKRAIDIGGSATLPFDTSPAAPEPSAPEPEAFTGHGGEFGGAGASGSWESPADAVPSADPSADLDPGPSSQD